MVVLVLFILIPNVVVVSPGWIFICGSVISLLLECSFTIVIVIVVVVLLVVLLGLTVIVDVLVYWVFEVLVVFLVLAVDLSD